MQKKNHFSWKSCLRWVSLLLLSIVFLFPFYWMLTTSIKQGKDIFAYPPQLIGFPITFQHYLEAWNMQNFTLYLVNTIKIVLFSIVFAIGSSSFVAYGFSRMEFRGRKILFMIVLATMIMPSEVLIIPQYLEFTKFGWLNTHLPLIVPTLFGNSFFIFLISQYMRGIPCDLDEAAKIDGCNKLKIFLSIILPLLKPVLATCVIFQFMNSWNDYMGPLIYLQTRDQWTMSLGIASMNSEQLYSSVTWGHRMAMATIFSIFPLTLFFFAQDKLIGGISMSGIKG